MLSFLDYEVFFWSGFLHTTTLMCSSNSFSHLFGILNFLTQTDHFVKAIVFGSRPILAIFKMLSFLEYEVFSGALFWTQQF